MTTADALLAAVLASPDDDLPRLVYADWYEENGDPERAEFIRLQVAHANGTLSPDGVIREKVLLDTHVGEWLTPLRKPGEPLFTQRSHAFFRRGFVEVVWLPAREFARHARRLFEVCPAKELRVIFDDVSEFRPFTECERLTRLHALDVCDSRFGPGATAHLVRSPHLRGLRVLRLPGCNIDDLAADLLCCVTWPLLATLDLRHNPLSDASKRLLRNCFGAAVLFE